MPQDDEAPWARETDVRHEGRGEAPVRERERRERPATPERPRDREQERPEAAPPPRSKRVWVILGLVALAAIVGGATYWYLTRNQETTDDAYTDGRPVVIAPQVAGYVTELDITDNQFVRTGDVLLRIDAREYVAARDQAAGRVTSAEAQLDNARAALDVARITYPARLASARAQRDSAQATLTRADADLRRQLSLNKAATTQTSIDEATATAAGARAQMEEAEAAVREAEPVAQYIAQAEAQVHELEGEVAQARAQLALAEVNLSYCTLVAPQDGWVTERNVYLGNYVNAGGQLFALVSPRVWVTANFKEDQLNRMRPGQTVSIAVDAYPGLKLSGHVDSIQKGSGERFSTFPAENATGNFVKIVQRVPVKIDIDSGLDPNLPLPLGLSVEPTVYLK
jgi:membrane fusion protein (multidrug efflux system)